MSEWPGLTNWQARELARELVVDLTSADRPEAKPGDAWLDARLPI